MLEHLLKRVHPAVADDPLIPKYEVFRGSRSPVPLLRSLSSLKSDSSARNIPYPGCIGMPHRALTHNARAIDRSCNAILSKRARREGGREIDGGWEKESGGREEESRGTAHGSYAGYRVAIDARTTGGWKKVSVGESSREAISRERCAGGRDSWQITACPSPRVRVNIAHRSSRLVILLLLPVFLAPFLSLFALSALRFLRAATKTKEEEKKKRIL